MYFVENDEYFVQALKALDKLFVMAKIHWHDWIKSDLENYIETGSVEHHRNAYGGMGSINDIIIFSTSHNSIEKEAEPWLNNLYMKLLSMAAKMSLQIQKDKSLDLERIKKEYKFPRTEIQGWKCLDCGHSEVSPTSLDTYLAHNILPEIIMESMYEFTLEHLVDDCFRVCIKGIEEKRQEVCMAAKKANIVLTQGPIRPCCSCGGSNTSIYRWRLSEKKNETGEICKVLYPSEHIVGYIK